MEEEFDADYGAIGEGADFLKESDPFKLFAAWLSDAETAEINDPNAMSVATVDEAGLPNVRILLLKGFSEAGFTFFTNFESEKGVELMANPKASLCFHWKSLRRQVRVRGLIAPVSREDSDEYFHSRPRGSQIGAWASQQSRELSSRDELIAACEKWRKQYGDGEIPRPEHWSGFLLTPLEIEFWHDRPYRLHDRLQFSRKSIEEPFKIIQLYP